MSKRKTTNALRKLGVIYEFLHGIYSHFFLLFSFLSVLFHAVKLKTSIKRNIQTYSGVFSSSLVPGVRHKSEELSVVLNA